MFEKEVLVGDNSYELNIGLVADAIYAIDTTMSLDVKFNFKENKKKIISLMQTLCSVDREYLNKKFRKKSAYIDICKKELKGNFNIKNREGLINYLDLAMRSDKSEKMNRTLDIYNFFDKTTKKYSSFADAIIDYYRLSDIDMEIDGDIEDLKEYYKKCFKIIFNHRELLNPNGIYALDICRAIQITKNGYIASYITNDTAIDYIESFGREISNKFNSWREFYKSLLLGFILEDFFESKTTISTSLLIEKIKNIDLALDKEISIYNYIKFRENPREDTSKILVDSYKFTASEKVELNMYKIKDILEQQIMTRDKIRKYNIKNVLDKNSIINLEDDEEVLSVYPERIFVSKNFKANKEDTIILSNKNIILILKNKKEIDIKKINIKEIDIELINIENKNLCYNKKIILKNVLDDKEYTNILQYYLIDTIKQIKEKYM